VALTGLTPEKIRQIAEGQANRYPVPQQKGPVRWFDREMRCANRGCSSPTYLKVEYVPRCMMHALQELNGLVVKMEERVAQSQVKESAA
jgi:hypothetical protein